MESKKCTKCNETKLVSEFTKRKSHSTGYASECKECKKAMDKAWYIANKDKHYTKMREWVVNNKEQVKSYHQEYRVSNRDTINDNNKRYKARNPHIVKANKAKRRAAIFKAITTTTCLITVQRIYESCPKGYHVDHIKPLARGGAHHQDNLCYLPAAFNISKSDKLLSEHPELNAQFNELAIFPNV